jgi:hypothetical protein
MNDKEDFYRYFSLSKAPFAFKKKQELFKLFEVPPKEKLITILKNFIHSKRIYSIYLMIIEINIVLLFVMLLLR